MRTALITGSTGFVGCNLVLAFGRSGIRVIAVDRSPPDPALKRYLGAELKNIRFLTADITDRTWAQALNNPGIDIVVHAAAVTNLAGGENLHRAADAISVNVEGTANVMAWAVRSRPSRIIYVSSSSVYGMIGGGSTRISETRRTAPSSIYAITKSAAELVALNLGHSADLSVIVARLCNPFGPMERTSADRTVLSAIQGWCDSAVDGKPLLIQRGYLPRDYCYIYDVARAVVDLSTARRLRHSIYNVSSGITTSGSNILKIIKGLIPETSVRRSCAPATNLIARPLSNARLMADTGWSPRYTMQSAIADYITHIRNSRSLDPAGRYLFAADPNPKET